MPQRKSKAAKQRASQTKPKSSPFRKVGNPYILEQGTLSDLRNARKRTESHLRYSWDYYSELAYQRNKIEDQLLQALNESCTSEFKFDHWQRAVKYRYSLEPLAALGSIKDIGGRFNIGEHVNPSLPVFQALYLAVDKDTALQETLGQIDVANSDLTPRELALTSAQSETIVSVSGQLDRVLDIRNTNALRKFSNLIKDFKLSDELLKRAESIGEDHPVMISTPAKLKRSLLERDWRIAPRHYDVPSNSQIFGHLVYSAKIEGIIYPSKLTNKDCLVAFPDNFKNTSSFVQLDDPAPSEVVSLRLDSSTV